MARTPSPPAECANCGAAIPRNARACPECGADERTGWRETAVTDGLDLPEAAFDDDPPRPSSPALRRVHLKWDWLAAGLLLLIWLVLGALTPRSGRLADTRRDLSIAARSVTPAKSARS